MKRCKILFIHQVGCRGGAGTMLANIITALDKQIFEPVVVCPDGDVVEQLVEAGAEVRISPWPIYQFLHYTGYSPAALNPHFIKHAYKMWRNQSSWQNYISDSGADIVCLNAMTLAPMAKAARRAGAKVMCIVQETSVRGLFGMRTAWLHHILSAWMDAVVFISTFERDKSHCRAPIVEVVPNWVDLSIFDHTYSQAKARAEFDIPGDSRVILMMGGVSELKGTLPLIFAAARLSKTDRFLIIVAGYSSPLDLKSCTSFQRLRFGLSRRLGMEYWQKVMRAIAKNGLNDCVRFIGMQSDVVHLYAAADILVFPATRPHQARPVLEAGAMGKPVVLPDFPQTREFVTHGVNGLTYKPGDINTLADALQRLIADREMASAMGTNNFHKTCENHDGSVNASKFHQIFIQLAKIREHVK